MKPSFLILALAACLTFAGDAPTPPSSHRFLITSGTIERDTVTLKMDTATGRTWLLYYALSEDKKRIPGWLEIEDDIGTVQKALEDKAATKASMEQFYKNAVGPVVYPASKPITTQ